MKNEESLAAAAAIFYFSEGTSRREYAMND
jgi:hypothetical protein